MKNVQGSAPLQPLAAVCIYRSPLGAVSQQIVFAQWDSGLVPRSRQELECVELRRGDKAGRPCRVVWCEPKSSEAWKGNM